MYNNDGRMCDVFQTRQPMVVSNAIVVDLEGLSLAVILAYWDFLLWQGPSL